MKKILLFIIILIPIFVFAGMKGDIDGDNKVGSSDYILLRKYLLKSTQLNNEQLASADVNGDGAINSADYVTIRKIIINEKPSSTIVPVTPTPVVTIAPTTTPKPTPVPTPTPTPELGKLEIHFMETGHYDDGILIRTNNNAILIDGGRYDRNDEKVVKYLKALGVKKLDYIIGSHLQDDHVEAQASVVRNFEVGGALYSLDIFTCPYPCVISENPGLITLRNTLKEYGIKTTIQQIPSILQVGDMKLYFIDPAKNKELPAVNDSSYIFILKYGENTFLFPGDAPIHTKTILDGLINNAKALGLPSIKIDMLKYPHHGNSNVLEAAVEQMKPSIVVVPNYYAPQFPYTSRRATFEKYGAQLYRQSDSKTGNILLISDGKNIEVKMDVNASDYAR